jgi:glyoxylase-like metal-dependent hydrolase (beta-lactamase superfamily II)
MTTKVFSITLGLALALFVSAPLSCAQNMTAAESHGQLNQDFAKAELHVLPVQGNVYMVVGDGANIAVQVGDQGILLVNTGFAQLSDKLVETIKKLSPKPVRYIIDTTSFADSTGGNEAMRRAGVMVGNNQGLAVTGEGDGAPLFAHENVLARLSAPSGKTAATSAGNWPTDTYFGAEKPLFFNGESIQVLYQPNANSDGDSIVYFRRSDVIYGGGIFNTDAYPVIDTEEGGSIEGVVRALTRMVRLSIVAHEEEGGTLVIPGHGHLCDQAEVVEYRDMVTIVRDRIQDMIKKGMTLDQVKAAKPTRDYDPLYNTNDFWTADMFVTAAYNSLKNPPVDKP